MTLTATRARELLRYDPDTGDLYRIARCWLKDGAPLGRICLGIGGNGYYRISVENRRYQAHRVMWLLMMGDWPEGQIDHINGARLDNRWVNLRDVSRSVNMQNQRRAGKRNKTGFLGVTRWKNGFRAVIQSRGRQVHLGLFKSPQIAHAAYVQAKRALHEGGTL